MPLLGSRLAQSGFSCKIDSEQEFWYGQLFWEQIPRNRKGGLENQAIKKEQRKAIQECSTELQVGHHHGPPEPYHFRSYQECTSELPTRRTEEWSISLPAHFCLKGCPTGCQFFCTCRYTHMSEWAVVSAGVPSCCDRDLRQENTRCSCLPQQSCIKKTAWEDVRSVTGAVRYNFWSNILSLFSINRTTFPFN